MEAGNWAYTSMSMGTTSGACPERYRWQQWPQTICNKLISVQVNRIYILCIDGISPSLSWLSDKEGRITDTQV